MRKILPLVMMPLLICGCVGMSTTDGDSTKQWITIVSSKSDLDGSTADVCYKFNLRFMPEEAIERIDTNKACITRCCWYSETKNVIMDFNEGFADDLLDNGSANRYTPEILSIRVSYSPFLKTIHAKAEQKGIITSDGTLQLQYDTVSRPEQFLDLDFGTATPKEFDLDNSYTGKYLFHKNRTNIRSAENSSDMTDYTNPDKEEAADPKFGDLDASEREEFIKNKLAYERRQAVLLVKRFFNEEIDAYILAIDKAKKAQGLVLMSNDRDWVTIKTGTPVYKVTCKVNGKLGKSASDMKDFPILCGTYEVNLDEKTVSPIDTAARSIINGEYIN